MSEISHSNMDTNETKDADLPLKQDSTASSDVAQKSPWTAKRIIAIVAIILLAGMYVFTLIAALTSQPGAGNLFRASLALTIAVPILAWIILWALGKFRGRDNF